MNDDMFAEPAVKQREPRIYRCEKHHWTLEDRTPVMKTSLKVFCPLCKDEFWARSIGELQNVNPNAGKMIDVKSRGET